MQTRTLVIGAILTSLLFAASAAQATPMPTATITQSASTTFPLSPGSKTLTFDQFDTHGGIYQLLSVQVFANMSEYCEVDGENRSDLACTLTMTYVGTGSITRVGDSSPMLTLIFEEIQLASAGPSDGIDNIRAGDDYYYFGAITGNASDDKYINTTSGMAPYVGNGTVDFLVHGTAAYSITGHGDTTTWTSNMHADADVTVVYTYLVPEPASMATLLIGAIGLLGRRIRK